MEDFDFAPELDELLRDPMLGDASGFERFLSSQEAGEAAPSTSDSAANSANAAHSRLNQPEYASSASTQTPAQRAEPAAGLSSSTPGKGSQYLLIQVTAHTL